MGEGETRQANLWLRLWVAPRKAFREILSTNPYRVIIWFALMSGILAALITLELLWAQEPERIDFHSPLFIAALLIAGMIFGIVQLYVVSWLYQLSGSWLGGKGSYVDVKCAVGWGMYPIIVSHLFALSSPYFMVHPLFSMILSLLSIIIGIWAIVMFISFLAEAHKFSPWRALAAILLALLLIFVALILIFLLIPLLSPLFVN